MFEQLGITEIGTYCALNTITGGSRLSRVPTTDYQETGMAHVVIIGASIGGLPAAYDLHSTLGKLHQIAVISNSDTFYFVPFNPWVAVGWRSRQDTTFELAPYLSKNNIAFIPMAAQEIKPDDNQVILVDGRVVDYDYLVIANGPTLAFDEVDSLGPRGYTHSVCTIDHAEKTYPAWQEFLQDPGHIVVGAVQMASCFGPAYEFAFIMDAELRKRKLRHQVPMTFVTAEPHIGHLGLGGVGDSQGMLEKVVLDALHQTHGHRSRAVQLLGVVSAPCSAIFSVYGVVKRLAGSGRFIA